MNNRLVVFFALVLTFSGFSSLVLANSPIPPGPQAVDSGTVIDFSNFNFNGKRWEETSSGDLLRLYYMKLGQEQLQGGSGTTPVTTTTTSDTTVNTSGSTLMGNSPIPPKSIFLKSTGTTTH